MNEQDDIGETALMHSSFPEMDRLLITHGALINIPDEKGSTALMIAAMHGNLEKCTLLIKHGAHIAIRNQFGRSSLHQH